MSDDMIHTPVTFDVHSDDRVTLSLGPMPFDDLWAVLSSLGSQEGQLSFAQQLDTALTAAVAEKRKAGEADE